MNKALLREVLTLTVEHLWLVSIAILIAVSIAVPLGIFLARRAAVRRWALAITNIVQTIPSLALFGFLLPVPLIGGIGKRTAIVALVLYALLPVLRNTIVGMLGVDRGDGERDRFGDPQAIGVDERETAAIDGLFQCGDQAAAVLVAADVGQPLSAWLADFFLVNRGQS